MMVAFSAEQNDDPSGPNIDLAPGSLQEKKMDVEKRGMGINDYNGDMRKGGRVGGGMPYRPPVSKEAAPGDAGSYYDKVMLLCPVSSLCVLCLSHVWITFCPFSLFSISSCGSTLSSWCTPFLPISPSLPASTPLKLVFCWLSLWQTLPLTNQDWCLGEEGPCSLYSPPTVYKPHSLFNHTIPFRQVR